MRAKASRNSLAIATVTIKHLACGHNLNTESRQGNPPARTRTIPDLEILLLHPSARAARPLLLHSARPIPPRRRPGLTNPATRSHSPAWSSLDQPTFSPIHDNEHRRRRAALPATRPPT